MSTPRKFKRHKPLESVRIGDTVSFTVNGHEVLMDAEDYHILDGCTLCITTRGYVQLHKCVATNVYTHHTLSRLIMHAPLEKLVDHISGNQLDNRKANLRLCSPSENARNRKLPCNSRSRVKGVRYVASARKTPWNARIFHNGVRKSLGYFATPEEAGAAYNMAAIQLFETFARINRLDILGETLAVKSIV